MVAERQDGERYAHHYSFNMGHHLCWEGCAEVCLRRVAEFKAGAFATRVAAEEAAYRLLNRIQEAYTKGQFKTPVARAHWSRTRPCYGSEAYEASGQEAEDAAMERKEAAMERGYGRWH